MTPRIIAGVIVFVMGIIGITLIHNFDPHVMVLCSNNERTCENLVNDYVKYSGLDAQMVRMPTSEALAYVRSGGQKSEFDVWIGGPAEAYILADRDGLLEPHQLDTYAIPSTMLTDTWVGTYGGVLAFCARANVAAPHTWDELAHYSGRIALPLPFSSGTAATMLSVQEGRGADSTYLSQLHSKTTTYTASGTVPAHLVGIGRADVAVTFEAYCPADPGNPHAPQLIIPADGTGYEVGAGAVLANGRTTAGRDFLRYIISARGQEVLVDSEQQNPISTELDNNLYTRLAKLDVPVFTTDLEHSANIRHSLVSSFAENVMYPHGVAGPLIRSTWISLISSVCAALVGALLALLYRISSRYRLAVISGASIPILFPSLAIASALTVGPIPIAPYGSLVLILTFALYATPVAFLVCVVFTSDLGTEHVMAAANAGADPRSALRSLYLPRLVTGGCISVVATSLWLISDNSAGAVYGGRDHLFIDMVLGAVSSNIYVYTTLAVCLLIAISGGIVAWYVGKRNQSVAREQIESEYSARAGAFIDRYFRRQRRWLYVVGAGWLAIVCYIVIVMLLSSDFATVPGDVLSRIGMKLWLSFTVTLVAVLIGVALAIHEWKNLPLVRGSLVCLLLSAPIAIGLLLTLLFRRSFHIDGVMVFPALVGGYSLGNGTIAVMIAYLALAVPLAYFFAVMMTKRMTSIARIARDIGAVRLRILSLVLWQMKGRLVALVVIVFGLTLTQTATLAFVQPAYLVVSSTNLVNLAERGELGEVFATSLVTGGIGALLIISGGWVLAVSRRREMRKSNELRH
ncbi:substrate-binding domain-containing protein [Arcanobacterium phocae]|uniref:substrate-binding domain-containing protein n=1 Tax=Arcanobacterium phocae TaxID=131112 RepID=UPI001C0F2906|nr:substrate-binding domain-containing protein [Arcanobacterium phocae]